ncbi:flagellar basal-body MS-ring/collar protein FliF [Amaricoccus tamworthensis]|uniref:flagellar basal-body MS-ring/collar protein FliF n=1 Tax=Amaricoccus tamworthensis TaxID=57002 RepID=UPI003C7CA8A6
MVDQIKLFWEKLEPRQRIIALLSAVAIVATMFGISRIASTPSMALLYSGLEPAASGEIVGVLEAEGVPFEVRNNSIYVDVAQRDRVRMDLASEGLPAGGPAGYEILDGLSGFGTTSQMFDAAYWRAKEGELARTISSARNVRSARVHLANPVSQPFSRDTTGSASVTVTMAGGALGEPQAEAIRYLVSSAVTGVDPESVAIIDSLRGVVLSGNEDELTRAGVKKPDEREESLRKNIQRLLEARVGPGKAIVEVSVEANMDSQTISERVIDPSSRVAISSEIEESQEDSSGTTPGVTVASNIPDGDVEGGGGESNRSASQLRERQNFEVSETRTERVVLPGQVRRINVAVMVDGITATDPVTGESTWEPRPEEEMETLRQLVSAAAGIDESRGDTVTIESLQFSPVGGEGALGEWQDATFMDRYGSQVIQVGVLAGIVLALIFFVLRPMMKPAAQENELAELLGIDQSDGSEDANGATALTDQSGDSDSIFDLPEDSVRKIDRLKEVISSRSEDSTAVLLGWIESPDQVKEPA